MKKKGVLLCIICFGIITIALIIRNWCIQPKISNDIIGYAENNICNKVLNEKNIIDLGSYIIAYRVPNDKKINSVYGTDEDFQGNYYIAIRAINNDEFYFPHDNIFYLPDIYGDIFEMKFEGDSLLYIRYKAADSDRIEETRIPIFLTDKLKEGFIDIRPFDNCYRKRIKAAQLGSQTYESVFPQTIWIENFELEDQTYEIIFERISPLYTFLVEVTGYYADYCLKVKDGQGNVISEQMIINFPVKYEEVYWSIDFSNDGFMDIAFCTDMYNVNRFGWTELVTLIWNVDKNLYEKKEFPVEQCFAEKWWDMQLWNRELSSIISFVGRTEKGDAIMERYLFANDNWNCVARLEPFYEEDDNGDLVYQGYQEVSFAIDGRFIDKCIIEESETLWSDEESIWSDNNEGNIKLYPCFFDWEEVQINIGEISVEKYIRIMDTNVEN